MKVKSLCRQRSNTKGGEKKSLIIKTVSYRFLNQGFSLLEILVAFTIMAIALSILLKIFSSGVNTAFVAEEYTAAVQIAESLIASVGIENELVIGENAGIKDEKYYWQTSINVINNPVNAADNSAIEFLQLKVSVSWDDTANQARVVELNTIIAGLKDAGVK